MNLWRYVQRALAVLTVGLAACRCLPATAQSAEAEAPRGALAPKPLYRDPVFDGAADPAVVWNFAERRWYMFYTNRRANLPEEEIGGVNWVHGTKIGIAASRDGAQWEYAGVADITHGGEDATYWAPDVVFADGQYHMFLTIVPGVFRDWNHPRSIAHLTSRDLRKWDYRSTLKLASDRVIDASVVQLPDGGWRMWYNNEADRKSIYYADSNDLFTWIDRGKVVLPDFPGGEGPKVFRWKNAYWLVADVWDGLAVYRSDDALDWQPQAERLLRTPGKGDDDGVAGQHADVVATSDRAYLFYFTHPGRGRTSDERSERRAGVEHRRSSIQVVELKYDRGALACDRDAPTYVDLGFRRRRQIHDPSTILRRGDRYWCFSTGMGVQSLSSTDLKNWRLGPPLFKTPPAWVGEVVPGNRGHFWAPDVIRWNDRYLVYYSVSTFGKRTSAIALASSPELDPEAPGYEWTDHGAVIQTGESNDYNAIDPCVVATPDGELWMAFGSFWSGIKLVELDPQTGQRIAPDSPVYSLAHNEEIEAPAIYVRDGYYYLFVNWGLCCRGVNSTYNIRVGRSRSITGPYVDRDGVNMLNGGGTLVLDSHGDAVGPGHAGFFTHDGQRMLSFHYYSREQQGRARLGIAELAWDSDGWPQLAPSPMFSSAMLRGE